MIPLQPGTDDFYIFHPPECKVLNPVIRSPSLPLSNIGSTDYVNENQAFTCVQVAAISAVCVVCGDKATYINYGAKTCEACKGFFQTKCSK